MHPSTIIGVILLALGLMGWLYASVKFRSAREKARKHPLATLFIALSIPKKVRFLYKYSPYVAGLGIGLIINGQNSWIRFS